MNLPLSIICLLYFQLFFIADNLIMYHLFTKHRYVGDWVKAYYAVTGVPYLLMSVIRSLAYINVSLFLREILMITDNWFPIFCFTTFLMVW